MAHDRPHFFEFPVGIIAEKVLYKRIKHEITSIATYSSHSNIHINFTFYIIYPTLCNSWHRIRPIPLHVSYAKRPLYSIHITSSKACHASRQMSCDHIMMDILKKRDSTAAIPLSLLSIFYLLRLSRMSSMSWTASNTMPSQWGFFSPPLAWFMRSRSAQSRQF